MSIIKAVLALQERFDNQDKKLDEWDKKLGDSGKQMKHNCGMIARLAKAADFNAEEVKDCKLRLSTMEKKVSSLSKRKCHAQRKSPGTGEV